MGSHSPLLWPQYHLWSSTEEYSLPYVPLAIPVADTYPFFRFHAPCLAVLWDLVILSTLRPLDLYLLWLLITVVMPCFGKMDFLNTNWTILSLSHSSSLQTPHLFSLLVAVYRRKRESTFKKIMFYVCSDYSLRSSRENIVGSHVVLCLCIKIQNEKFNMNGEWIVVHMFLHSLGKFTFLFIINKT